MRKIKIGISQINNSFSGAHYLPYAAGVLQTYFQKYAKKNKYQFLIPLFKRIKVSDAVIQFKDADVVGFSLYSWNEQLSLAIAKALKEKNKKIKIIFGGPQVDSDNSKEFLETNKFIDFVVNGEGEKVFLNLIESLDKKDFSNVEGISFLNNSGDFVMNPKPKRIGYLDDIPSPYLSGVFDDLINKYPDDEWLILWETNRGCPFKCTFCDWGSARQQN